MNSVPRLVSRRFPYLPLRIVIQSRTIEVEALLDTGFDGDVVVPPNLVPADALVTTGLPLRLADGSDLVAPAHLGTVQLGSHEIAEISVVALGDVPLVGVNVIKYFSVTLDHGRPVIVEP